MKRIIKKVFYVVISLLLLLVFLFFNIGDYIDTTTKAEKSDIIACLGGSIERTKKSLWLHNHSYGNSNKIILTNGKKTHIDYIKKNAVGLDLIVSPKLMNTAEEIRYLKKYMISHKYKSVIIVSDPPHSKRIKILTNLITLKGDEDISYVLVDNNAPWWDKEYYYRDKTALRFALAEALKIPYTFFWYGLMKKVGFRWQKSEYLALKKMFDEFTVQLCQ